MAEQLKVFNNAVDAVSTSAITNISIATNDAASQAVIKNIEYTAIDPLYTVTATLKLDDKIIVTGTSAVEMTGFQTVDVSSTFELVLETGADQVHHGQAVAMLFNGTDSAYSTDMITDTNNPATPRLESAMAYADVIGDFSVVDLGGADLDAYSGFGWMDGATQKFSRMYSDRVYTYDNTQTLLQMTNHFLSNTYGSCTDGTYFYGKRDYSDNILQRFFVSNGVDAGSMTLSRSFYGLPGNGASFMLHYDGFLYIKRNGGTDTIYKVNTTTGNVTTISVNSSGSYSVGALITVALDGVAYLMEVGSDQNDGFIMNLETEEINYPEHDSINSSTEYGNLALELSPGVALFFYESKCIWLDANTMTGALSRITSSSIGMPNMDSNNSASSIANIPIHENPSLIVRARAVTYSLYADGVAITGVS